MSRDGDWNYAAALPWNRDRPETPSVKCDGGTPCRHCHGVNVFIDNKWISRTLVGSLCLHCGETIPGSYRWDRAS